MSDWNSEQYLKFKRERTQPAADLLSHVPLEAPVKILDIGCGPGNSTQVLAQRYPNAKIIGIDSSENMIAAARKNCPQLEFRLCDASSELETLGNDFDLVFSNACIQWIENHDRIIPYWMSVLKSGGALAVQTPMNSDGVLIEKVTGSDRWKTYIPDRQRFFNLTPEEYFDLLSEVSPDFSLWMTVYYHNMNSHEDILEWYRSTGLKPYLEALPEEKRELFLQDILEGIREAYPAQANGRVIFRFPRFFFIARK